MDVMNRVAMGNFARYTAASAIAVTITQIALLGFALFTDVPALAAGIIAFVLGAVPQFLIMKRWARGGLPWQVGTFVTVTLASGVASIGLVVLVDGLIGPSIVDRETRALALNAGYLLG